jgi:hypothetical protein
MRKRERAFGAIPQIKNAHPVTKHHPDVLWRRSRLWLRSLQNSLPDRGSWRGYPDRWKQMRKNWIKNLARLQNTETTKVSAMGSS